MLPGISPAGFSCRINYLISALDFPEFLESSKILKIAATEPLVSAASLRAIAVQDRDVDSRFVPAPGTGSWYPSLFFNSMLSLASQQAGSCPTTRIIFGFAMSSRHKMACVQGSIETTVKPLLCSAVLGVSLALTHVASVVAQSAPVTRAAESFTSLNPFAERTSNPCVQTHIP